jgi:hypothetical protein
VNRIAGLDDLIRRARRRLVANLCLRQGVNAACAAMGGVILLLIVGAQILDWRWLAAVAAAGAAAGVGLVRRQAPPRYRIAQLIDRNLGLHDSVSTAFFYNRMSAARGAAEDMRAAQLAEAERLARDVNIERAVPFSTPRSVYVMAVLGLIASGLLGLRYGITRSLDLKPPLAALLLNALGRDPQPPDDRMQDQKRYRELLSQLGLTQENSASDSKTAGFKPSAATADAQSQQQQKQLESRNRQQSPGSAQAENMRQERERAAAEGAQNSERQGDRRTGPDQSAANSPSAQQLASTQQHESSSLVDKVRDALSSLMSRFSSQPRQAESRQQIADARSRPDSGNGQNGDGSQQKSGRGQRQQSAENGSSGAQGQGEQQKGDSSQMAQSGNRSKGEDSENASKQPGSGIGSRDGNKEIRQAEQLAAMGKISEIIGRRSQNLTGDATIEVASGGPQHLRTGYSQQNASHTDSGGEISRDEIPLAYQNYVQRYFEQVRKQAAPAAPVKK